MKKIPFLLPLLVLIGCIVVYYYFFMPANTYKGKKRMYEVWVTENPKISETRTTATAEILKIHTADSTVSAQGKILLNILKDTIGFSIKKGDKLLIFADFIGNFEAYPDAFDYDKYLRQNGYMGSMFLRNEDIKIIGNKRVWHLRSLAEDCQNYLSQTIRKFIRREREQAVLLALTIGERDYLDADIRRQYSTAGAVHILAVSGLHVGIVLWILNKIFTLFGLIPIYYKQRWRKRFRLGFVISGLSFYAFLTGLSPSVVRSTVMFIIFYIGWHNERQMNIYNNICAAAFLTLLIDPLSLFSVSFQLSYSAVLGIVYLHPKISSVYRPKRKIIREIRGLLSVSLAAQIGTLPFSLYYFGQTSIVFFLTNLIIIPLTSYITLPLAFTLISVSWIPIINKAVAFVLEISVWLMNEYIALLNKIPFATFQLPTSFIMAVCLIGILLFFSLFMQYKKWTLLVLSVAFYSLFVFDYNYNWLKTERTHRLLFPRISGTETMIEQCGHSLYVFSNDYDRIQKHIENLRKGSGSEIAAIYKIKQTSAESYLWDNKQILWLSTDTLAYYEAQKQIDCDLLILGRCRKTNMKSLQKSVNVKEGIVLLPDFPYWKNIDDAFASCKILDIRKGYATIENIALTY